MARPAGQRASVWGSNWSPPSPAALLLHRRTPHPHRTPPHPASPSAGPGKTSSVAPWPDCAPFPYQPDGAPSAPDPSTGQPQGLSRKLIQPSPPVPLPACRRAVFAGRRHCRPPPGHWRGHRALPSTPSIGTGPGPFAFPATPVSLRWIRGKANPALRPLLVRA